MSFEIRKFQNIKIKLILYPSYRHKTAFTISPIFDQTEKNEHNIRDLRHYVGKENGDDIVNSSTQFIVCYSTQNQNLH
jgi:hypothetical protein